MIISNTITPNTMSMVNDGFASIEVKSGRVAVGLDCCGVCVEVVGDCGVVVVDGDWVTGIGVGMPDGVVRF